MKITDIKATTVAVPIDGVVIQVTLPALTSAKTSEIL
jgi:hypothetical protein